MADKINDKNTENRRAGDAPADNKKKMPLMLIVGVVAVLGMVGMFLIGSQVSAKSRSHKPVKVEAGPVMTLDEFLVNTADPGGDHFLKVTIGLELSKAKGKTPESMKEQTSLVRDAILMSLSSKTRDDLGPIDGREKLKGEIKKRVNAALGEDDIQGVYFTNFVTQ